MAAMNRFVSIPSRPGLLLPIQMPHGSKLPQGRRAAGSLPLFCVAVALSLAGLAAGGSTGIDQLRPISGEGCEEFHNPNGGWQASNREKRRRRHEIGLKS